MSPPWVSSVALTTSVETVTFSDSVDVGVVVGNAPGTLVGVAAALAAGSVELGNTAETPLEGAVVVLVVGAAVGLVTATGLNNDGFPLALFQPS